MALHSSTLSWAFVAFSALGLLPAANAEPGRHTVLVMLQNLARAPSAPVELAQAEASRLYALIGVDVVWVTEVPDPPRRLRVVCLTTMEPLRELNVADSAVGYTLLPLGKRAIRTYVFWPRVERAARELGAVVDKVLAIAIAHELGHMLLPDGSHAKSGLMAAVELQPLSIGGSRPAGLFRGLCGTDPARGREGRRYASGQFLGTVTT